MAYYPATIFPASFLSDSSVLLSGGVLYAYLAETTTPTPMYLDGDGTSIGTSVTLNARGEPQSGGNVVNIWLDDEIAYKFILKDASAVTKWTVDGLTAPGGTLRTDLVDNTDAAKGASLVGYRGRTVYDRLDDALNVKDFGALGDGSADDTADIQANADANLADANDHFSLHFPRGKYMMDTVTIDLADSVGVDKVTIYGEGQASMLTARSSPNQPIFQLDGGSGASFSTMIHGFRVGVSSQGDNVIAPFVLTGSGSTCLDFQFYDIYVNGLPRGFQGQFVSGMFTNIMFDYMTDYAIYAPNKEFRKIEIVGNHFYKVKDAAIRIDGHFNTSGGATSQSNRDETQASGHMAIVGNGFDRYYDTAVAQKMIDLDTLDNFVMAGNWFNGKTPTETNTGSNDAIELTNCDNFATGVMSAYYLDRGYYFNNCTNFMAGPLTIRKGNLLASSGAGAVHFEDCDNFQAALDIQESGGHGLFAKNCSNATIFLTCTLSQYCGAVLSDCQNVTVYCNIVDANQADSSDSAENVGVLVTGSASPKSNNCRIIPLNISVSSVSQGQRSHVTIGTNCTNCTVSGGYLGNERTGYSQFIDNGSGTRKRDITNFTLRNNGTATINNPATSVVVAHGLDVAPSIAHIDVRLSAVSTGVTKWWVSGIDATNFTINVDATPSGSASFVWAVNSET